MWRAIRATFGIAVATAELALRACLALPRAIGSVSAVVRDVVKSRRALRGGTLHCPVGHEIATEGDSYECSACLYVYGGRSASIWECGNVECKAITPYVSCPTCGLSVRNPYRWGRP